MTAAIPAVAGALIGKVLGPKQQDPQSAATSAAASAPSQTPDQAEASGVLKPYLTDWMKKTPQLPFRAYTPTKITYGGVGPAQQPRQIQQTPTQGGQPMFGGNPGFAAPANMFGGFGGQAAPANVGPAQQISPAQKSSGFNFNPGTWSEDRSAIDNAKSALDAGRADYQKALADSQSASSRSSSSSSNYDNTIIQSAFPDPQTGQYSMTIARARQLGIAGGTGPDGSFLYSAGAPAGPSQFQPVYPAQFNGSYYNSPQGPVPSGGFLKNVALPPLNSDGTTGVNHASQATQEMLDAASGRLGGLQKAYDSAMAVGPQKTFNAGSMNIPEAPVADSLFGSVGAWQPNPDYSGLVAQTMQPTAPTGFGYAPNNWSSLAAAVGAPIQQDANGGYVQNNPRTNRLEKVAQNQIVSNMDRTLPEGFDSTYLKDLAAQGVDPLKEAYGISLDKASADMNRMGIKGSGFEVHDKYGSQPDSITSRFLTTAGNVARDVGLQGAQAAREDRFRNAGLQDNATAAATALSGRQEDNQYRTDQANESNRQYWSQFGRQGESLNRDLTARAADIAMKQDQANQAQQQYWNEDALKKQQINNQNISQGVNQLSQLGQQNEANRQWWANTLEGQQKYDDAQRMSNWQTNLDVLKYLAGRDDAAQQANLGTQQSLDKMNMLDIPQMGITNLINFINGQGSAANNQQQNYWQAFNAANAQNQQNLGQQASIGQMASGLINNYMNQPKAPVVMPVNTYTAPAAINNGSNLVNTGLQTLLKGFGSFAA